MTRETINNFNGRDNVSVITREDGSKAYMTQTVPFADAVYSMGAAKINTFENESKHALMLYNDSDAEVGRCYLTKKLQGKSPEEIAELKHSLVFYDSWLAEKKQWVPCIALSSQVNLAKTAVAI